MIVSGFIIEMDKGNYLIELENGLYSLGENQGYVEACVEYARNLLDHNMPVIFDINHLSLLIGINRHVLYSYIFGEGDRVYSIITIPKKRGGKRQLSIPCYSLNYIQRWILDNVLSNTQVSDSCMGFTISRSIVTNAKVHLGADVIINVDIKDFFPSINIGQIYQLFRYYGYTKEIAFSFARLCTYDGVLPQGAPTSPCISNLVCLKLDKRLSSFANTYNASYTRYADDLSFSGKGKLEKMLPIIEKIINEEGFKLNHEKTRVLRKGARQEITGIVINDGKLHVSREYKRKLMQEIYYCQKYGYENHQQHVGDDHRFFRDHLYGKAYFIKMIEHDLGKKLIEELDKINWEV